MRILFATTQGHLPQRVGGAGSMTHDLCLALKARGTEVAVLAACRRHGLLGFVNAVRRKLDPGRHCPPDHVMGYPVYRGPLPARGVAEVVSRFAPTVAVVQAGTPMILVNALVTLGVPTVLYVHDVFFDDLGAPFSAHPLLAVIANSNFTASRFEAAFGILPHVLPPFVNANRYRVETDRSKVVFIGLAAMKGVERAFELAAKRRDIPFVFVESWPLTDPAFQAFRQRADALGNVTVLRSVEDMRPIYRQARLLLAPSMVDEAWGRVCTEAQCSGVPVLASNRGGLPEAVGPGGLLVNSDAPLTEWLAALSTFWDDAAAYERFSHAALAHAAREGIRFDHLVADLLDQLGRHVAACAARPDASPSPGRSAHG